MPEGGNKDADLQCRKGGIWLVEVLLRPFWLHLSYFGVMSVVGFVPLWMSSTRSKRRLNPLDAYFSCVSALTVTSLTAVRMQEFSEFQLAVIIILMLMGEEVFTSMLCLHIERLTYHYRAKLAAKPEKLAEPDGTRMPAVSTNRLDLERASANSVMPITSNKNTGAVAKYSRRRMPRSTPVSANREVRMEDLSPRPEILEAEEPELLMYHAGLNSGSNLADGKAKTEYDSDDTDQATVTPLDSEAHQLALSYLAYIALIYLVSVQIVGILLIVIYFRLSPHSEEVLKTGGVKTLTFAVFTAISSFANCGFIPLDDNMMPFRKDAALLCILAAQILLGNTVYAPCLRAVIWTLHRFAASGPKKRTYHYILQNSTKLYSHLFPRAHTLWLMLTVVGFLAAQIILLCALQWETQALDGLNAFQKIVCGIFQSVSTRHVGETVVIPMLLDPAILVLYIVMMYLPAYPVDLRDEECVMNAKPPPAKCSEMRIISAQLQRVLLQRNSFALTVVIILICITERDALASDPLNYNVLNIVFEVVSAYGNVGLSIGYSCQLLKKLSNKHCKDVAISFSGKWSIKGKILIIFVMFLGRLKGIQRGPFPTPLT